MRVVCLGVHILDILGGAVRDPTSGRDTHLVDEVRITVAGTAGGTAVDLAKLGAEVISIGAIGADDLGDLLLARLAAHGVDVSRLARKPLGTSATMMTVREDGERFLAFHRPGASPRLEGADVDLEAIAGADLLHVGAPDALGDFATGPLVEILAFAKAHGVPVTMDLLGRSDAEALTRLTPALAQVDYFLPNNHQVREMTGLSDPRAGARALLALGPSCVVVTCGAAGSIIVSADMRTELPVLEGPVVDTTGCGDAYTAGFIVGTLKGYDLRARGLLGAACAALVAGGLGSDTGIVDLEATLDFLGARHEDVRTPVSGPDRARESDV